jgi:hypothetical protein
MIGTRLAAAGQPLMKVLSVLAVLALLPSGPVLAAGTVPTSARQPEKDVALPIVFKMVHPVSIRRREGPGP